MARPTKHKLEKRTEHIDARYTLLEAERVQQQANAAGLSKSEFSRKRTLGERIMIPRVRGIDPAAIVELDRLVQEVNAIGNNVNQVARAMNSNRRLPPGWDRIPAILEELRMKAETTLDELVGGDGS